MCCKTACQRITAAVSGNVLNPDGSSNVESGTVPDVVPEIKGRKDTSYLGLCLDYIKGNS